MDDTGVQIAYNIQHEHMAPIDKREEAKSVAAEQGKTISVVCSVSTVTYNVCNMDETSVQTVHNILSEHVATIVKESWPSP
ncbi:hypothetical protein CDAR_298571 [Caerostris darwini]|uniref:Uncharacterized protein n=1 Tax=Caerostris darwini TaxID=1538125 RepID=A0AAV4TMH2_9ARAC|nr:hypothetical protein CDAR_298571 [Caerostris darwini]